MMREDLQELWKSVESRKWRILETVARLSPEDQAKPLSKGGGYSALGTIEHLVLAEELQMQQIEAASHSEIHPKRSLSYKLAVRTLRTALPLPGPKNMQPNGGVDLEELGNRWEAVRQRLRKRLDHERDDRALMIHEVFGAMGSDQVLELTDAHLQYHQKRLGAS